MPNLPVPSKKLPNLLVRLIKTLPKEDFKLVAADKELSFKCGARYWIIPKRSSRRLARIHRSLDDEADALMLTQSIARFGRFLRQEDGPTATEYAVLLSLIVVLCVGAVKQMSNATGSSFDASAQAIDSAFNQ